MSEISTRHSNTDVAPPHTPTSRTRVPSVVTADSIDLPSVSRIARVRSGVALLLLLLPPFYLDKSWLQIGIIAMTAAVAAIGLTLLTGTAGQLSLAHAFFVGVGAYGYAFLVGQHEGDTIAGLGLPSVIAAMLAVCLAGLCGLAFGPVAARLGGLYLGVASLALVFVGAHLLRNATSVTGGYNGRSVAPLEIGGVEISGTTASTIDIVGVPFGGTERLWYVALVVLWAAFVATNRIIRGRPGRALQLIRDNAAAAGSMGIPVRRSKVEVFAFSSLFAGAGGVLTALASESLVPQHFDLHLSILFLAMVIIGGLGSVPGAVAGAVFVSTLPLLLERFSGSLGLLAASGSGGFDATTMSRFVFAAALVLVLVAEPGGLAALGRKAGNRLRHLRR